MDQHPVPRDITGFKFQLIGFMTIKQFGYVVAGALFGFLMYQLPISIFRYPVAAIFGLSGIAFAFIPIQERPLEVWVSNLIKAVNSPTQYVWKKHNTLPDYMIPTAKKPQKVALAEAKQAAMESSTQHLTTRKKLDQYLETIQPTNFEVIDEREKGDLSKISTLFNDGQEQSYKQPIQSAEPPNTQRPQEKVATANSGKRFVTPALPVGIIAGLVRDSDLAIPGMLVHITDQAGKQIRLFKTNVQGKFTSAIGLPTGTYDLSVEDPTHRYTFKPFIFEISDREGVRPWLIAPTSKKQNQIN